MPPISKAERDRALPDSHSHCSELEKEPAPRETSDASSRKRTGPESANRSRQPRPVAASQGKSRACANLLSKVTLQARRKKPALRGRNSILRKCAFYTRRKRDS